MATKIVVIDVDLGAKIDDIIAESVSELTGNAREELTKAIDMAKDIQRVKQEREQASKEATTKLDQAMEAARVAIAGAGDLGLAANAVMDIVKDVVTTLPAFTTRMKKILANQGNLVVLDRFKRFGVPYYRFLPFNQPVDG